MVEEYVCAALVAAPNWIDLTVEHGLVDSAIGSAPAVTAVDEDGAVGRPRASCATIVSSLRSRPVARSPDA